MRKTDAAWGRGSLPAGNRKEEGRLPRRPFIYTAGRSSGRTFLRQGRTCCVKGGQTKDRTPWASVSARDGPHEPIAVLDAGFVIELVRLDGPRKTSRSKEIIILPSSGGGRSVNSSKAERFLRRNGGCVGETIGGHIDHEHPESLGAQPSRGPTWLLGEENTPNDSA